MHTPGDGGIERMWVGDDGVIRLRWVSGTHITRELAEESEQLRREVAPAGAYLMVIHLDGVQGMDRDARLYFSQLEGPAAVALVGLSPIARVIGNLFLGLNHTDTPLHMFAGEDEAVAWLLTCRREEG